MNKYKKIATAVVATVMAGTMALSLAACNGGGGDDLSLGENTGATIDNAKITSLLDALGAKEGGLSQVRENAFNTGWTTAKSYWNYLKSASSSGEQDRYNVLNDDGTLNYAAYERTTPVTLNIAIGHNSADTGTHFKTSKTITLPDGVQYTTNNAKPAWKAMGEDLNITWNDVWGHTKDYQSSSNLTQMITDNSYANTDMFTTDLSVAVSQAAAGTSILNLANYLDYMPNFKAFLEANPVVYLSLLQSGMSTTDGSNKTLYVAPYFDGYDDIERYCLMRQDLVEKLLNGSTASTSTATFKDVCGATPSVSAYMGAKGKLEIDSLNAAGTDVIKIVKNYTAALDAAKDETTALGKAYKAIAGAAYTEDSGNIVDLMNYAVKANNEATGAQLLDLFRAYIDVAYQKEDGSAYYTAATRANLFNGYDACWDADDLCALLRCAMTNSSILVAEGHTLQGIAARDGTNDRTPDIVSLAGQLFGARGATSRFEQTYIDSKGVLQDARNDAHYWEAMALLHNFRSENLVANYAGYDAFKAAEGISINGDVESMMLYDYSQTQTAGAIAIENGVSGVTRPTGYRFGPVMTPVARWDVDGDNNFGEDGEIFRFTESWRSTKTGGLALNGALASAGNEDKLKAALQFVDYLYSEDGQIVSTFGPMATNANGAGGFWYNTESTKGAANTFQFKGKYYTGTVYKGKATPTITSALYTEFTGKNGTDNFVGSDARNFTNYARELIGSTLPVGVKNQSFENQLTAQMGRDGANKVGAALAAGTVKGPSLAIDENNYWYTCVPTGLPIASNIQRDILDANDQVWLRCLTGYKSGSSKNFWSIMNYIVLNGLTGTYTEQNQSYTF